MSGNRIKHPTLGDIRKAIDGLPDDMPVGLVVYGHSWYGPCHSGTHGGMQVCVYQFSDKTPILLFAHGEPSDGYNLKRVGGDHNI